jgi:hypothetical protein
VEGRFGPAAASISPRRPSARSAHRHRDTRAWCLLSAALYFLSCFVLSLVDLRAPPTSIRGFTRTRGPHEGHYTRKNTRRIRCQAVLSHEVGIQLLHKGARRYIASQPYRCMRVTLLFLPLNQTGLLLHVLSVVPRFRNFPPASWYTDRRVSADCDFFERFRCQ